MLLIQACCWYFTYYAGLSALFPYLNLYFSSRLNFTNQEIGVLSALRPWITGLAAPPIAWGADRYKLQREVFLGVSLAALVLRTCISLPNTFLGQLVLTVLHTAVGAPIGAFVDTAVLSHCTQEGEYGKHRLFASLGWGMTALFSGGLASGLGLKVMFWIYAVMTVVSLLASWFVDFSLVVRRDDDEGEPPPPQPPLQDSPGTPPGEGGPGGGGGRMSRESSSGRITPGARPKKGILRNAHSDDSLLTRDRRNSSSGSQNGGPVGANGGGGGMAVREGSGRSDDGGGAAADSGALQVSFSTHRVMPLSEIKEQAEEETAAVQLEMKEYGSHRTRRLPAKSNTFEIASLPSVAASQTFPPANPRQAAHSLGLDLDYPSTPEHPGRPPLPAGAPGHTPGGYLRRYASASASGEKMRTRVPERIGATPLDSLESSSATVSASGEKEGPGAAEDSLESPAARLRRSNTASAAMQSAAARPLFDVAAALNTATALAAARVGPAAQPDASGSHPSPAAPVVPPHPLPRPGSPLSQLSPAASSDHPLPFGSPQSLATATPPTPPTPRRPSDAEAEPATAAGAALPPAPEPLPLSLSLNSSSPPASPPPSPAPAEPASRPPGAQQTAGGTPNPLAAAAAATAAANTAAIAAADAANSHLNIGLGYGHAARPGGAAGPAVPQSGLPIEAAPLLAGILPSSSDPSAHPLRPLHISSDAGDAVSGTNGLAPFAPYTPRDRPSSDCGQAPDSTSAAAGAVAGAAGAADSTAAAQDRLGRRSLPVAPSATVPEDKKKKKRRVGFSSFSSFGNDGGGMDTPPEGGSQHGPGRPRHKGRTPSDIPVAYFEDRRGFEMSRSKLAKTSVRKVQFQDVAPSRKELREIAKDPQVILLLIIAAFWGVATGTIDNYLFLYLDQLKAPEVLMGLCLTLNCIAEVPVFLLSGPILEKLGHRAPFHVVSAAFCLRLFYYYVFHSIFRSPWAVLMAEPLHGITFGLGWAAGCERVRVMAPQGWQTFVQQLFSAAYFGLGNGIGGLIGGTISEHVAYRSLFGIAFLIMLFAWAIYAMLERELIAMTARRTKDAEGSAARILDRTARGEGLALKQRNMNAAAVAAATAAAAAAAAQGRRRKDDMSW